MEAVVTSDDTDSNEAVSGTRSMGREGGNRVRDEVGDEVGLVAAGRPEL